MKNGPYELVIAPKNYPGKKYRGKYCYEHHLVWWKYKKQKINPGMQIHHKNGNHRDNRVSNLELISAEEHSQIHALKSKLKAIRSAICSMCNSRFPIMASRLRDRLNRNDGNRIYCSHRCHIKYQRNVLGVFPEKMKK